MYVWSKAKRYYPSVAALTLGSGIMTIIPLILSPSPSPSTALHTGTRALETGSLGLKHFSGVMLKQISSPLPDSVYALLKCE